MEQINLEQKIDFFTASTGIFDLILVSNGLKALDNSNANVEPELSNQSNHYPIKMKLSVETKCLLKRHFCPEVVYSYCKGDYQKLTETLIINKPEPYCWSNPDKITELWYKWLQNALQEAIPKRTAHRALLPPWINQKTSQFIKCLQIARRKNPEAHTKVQILQELVNTSSNMDEILYEDKLAQGRSTSNFKAFRKSNLPPRMFNKEFTADSDKVKEDFFAKFFYSVHSKSSSFAFSRDWSAGMPVLKEVSIEKKEAMKICKNLNVNISKGPDELPPFLFHKLCISLSPSLTQIYQKILQIGDYPKIWKVATVSALHKKNDKCDVSNYRPVSLRSIPSKIL